MSINVHKKIKVVYMHRLHLKSMAIVPSSADAFIISSRSKDDFESRNDFCDAHLRRSPVQSSRNHYFPSKIHSPSLNGKWATSLV